MTVTDAPATDSSADPVADQSTGQDSSGSMPGKRRRLLPSRISLILYFVLAVVCLVGLGWLLSWSSPVPVRDMVVVGASEDSEDAIRAAAQVQIGLPLRDIDTSQISERVLALPGITGVDIDIKRPWTVAVVVDERFPFAQIKSDAGFTVVDADGELIREDKKRIRKLPEITGSPESRGLSFEVLGQLPQEIVGTVALATASEDGHVTLTLRDKTVVELGDATELARKAQLVLVLQATKPSVINVVTPDRPALQGDLSLPKANRPSN